MDTTGIIKKSNPKSFFVRMHYNSQRADKLFDEQLYLNEKHVVLQILLIHEGWIMCEVIAESKYLDVQKVI